MQFLGGLRPNASVGQRAADADPRAQPSSRVYGKSFHSSPYIWPRKMSPNCERGGLGSLQFCAQYASIFRLLLKVAVSVTHQCALSNFCKASCLYFFATPPRGRRPWPAPGRKRGCPLHMSVRARRCERIYGHAKIVGLQTPHTVRHTFSAFWL